MKAAGSASVVLMSTVAVQSGMSFHASIAMAKGAIEGLTRSLAAEWAPQIRVNAVAPSLVNTDLAARLLSTPEKVDASGKRHPLQRVGEPADIASAVLFLLGDGSAWMTGQVMAVDGGLGSLR
jgi:NAD(P)-dependent dehydrogenase (short-subunit alcohol dehydrogenase family)